MKKAIIIPVYLRLERPEDLSTSEGMVLTRRALQSLEVLAEKDFTLILPVCLSFSDNREEFLHQGEEAFHDEIRHCRPEGTIVFSPSHLGVLRKWLETRTAGDFASLIGLEGYSKIRNMGLLIAQAFSIDVAVFIDNDEVIEDPDYLEKATEYLGERWNDGWVSGKGGFYLNPDGSILLPSQKKWWSIFWDKTKWMNETYKRILDSKDRLVPTPMLLGGNLVLHQRLFEEVPFDPFIPRGEDTDYLINALGHGFRIPFDRELRIKHLHPVRTEAYHHQEVKGDIERFLYERQKLQEGPTLELDPYPGHFLRRTLSLKAFLTAWLLCLDYLGRGQSRKAKETLSMLRLLLQERKEVWPAYIRFQKGWKRVMKIVRKEGMGSVLGERERENRG